MTQISTDSDKADTDKREQLRRDGFCQFPNVLSPDLLERLRTVTDRLLDAVPQAQANAVRSQGSMLPVTLDPLFAELISLPAALDALRSLGFTRPTYTDGYVISKPAGGPRLFWHYDWFAWQDPRSYADAPPQVFAMYYLSDTTRENGCLRVLPGSHTRHTLLHDRLDAPHSAQLGAAADTNRVEFSDWPGEADVCVRAGDLLIGDARLLHAAHENTTDERRTLITLWYQPEYDALPERMRAQMAAKAQPIPADWPDASRALLQPLVARYDGTALPYERTLYRPNPWPEERKDE